MRHFIGYVMAFLPATILFGYMWKKEGWRYMLTIFAITVGIVGYGLIVVFLLR